MNATHPFHGPPMTPEPFEAQLPPPRPPCCAPPPMKTLDWEKPRQIPKFANPDHTQGKVTTYLTDQTRIGRNG